MSKQGNPICILMADDDEDDRHSTRDAFERNRMANDFRTVNDGEELMAFLRRQGKYANAPRPGLILLDLNMPKKDGREALAEIKRDPALRSIPTVVLTTSSQEEDILRSYDLGANSYITKPVTFEALVKALGTLGKYWVQVVELPDKPEQA
ncbi:MAG: response regulator [Myxococcota bacterium]|nr:response regulator [Myxococcota bacterium]